MKTSAIYCRVSTAAQEREGTSPETQLTACLTHCEEKGYDIAYRFNETYSGLTLERPELKRLRDVVRKKHIDIVVVHSLDHLSRDPVHGVIIVQKVADYAGV